MNLCPNRNLLLAAAFVVGLSSPLRADLVTFDFRAGGTPGTEIGPIPGNQWVFTINGLTLTASAWSLLGPTPGAFARSWLGMSPIGICNTDETCAGSSNWPVDNFGQGDFVLFQFSQRVSPVSVGIRPRGSDSDVTYLTADGAPAGVDLTGLSLATLGNGFGPAFHDDTNLTVEERLVALSSGPANSVLFGARVGGGDLDDFFKVVSITVETYSVPEPGTLLLALAAPALGLVGFRRRRKA